VTIRIIDTSRNQKAVYWPVTTDAFGRIVPDNFSEPTFGPPVVLDVMWMDEVEVFTDSKGNTRQSKAIVFTGVDVANDGMMLRGDMTNVPAGFTNRPKEIQGAALIRKFTKVPTLKGDQYVRKAYL